VAAEVVLYRNLPELLDGTAPRIPLDLARGSYFGGRKPGDGRIDWNQAAWSIHNLIRAVAPPYPGAFTELGGQQVAITGSFFRREPAQHQVPCLYRENDTIYADCADGLRIRLLGMKLEGSALTADAFTSQFGSKPVFIGEPE
jgi:methionyl-tRNA formyltransferase